MINAHALGYFQRILIGPDISESPTFLAQFFGAGDMKNIRKTLGFMVLVCGIIAGLFFLVTFGFPRTVLRLFTDIPVMIDLGAKYMRIAAFSTLFLVLAIPSNTALRSIQKPHIPLVTGIISFATNTILNYVLIFGKFGFPKLGVIGAAIGSTAPNLLASLTTGRQGKRAALLNLMFNLFRAVLLTALIRGFSTSSRPAAFRSGVLPGSGLCAPPREILVMRLGCVIVTRLDFTDSQPVPFTLQ